MPINPKDANTQTPTGIDDIASSSLIKVPTITPNRKIKNLDSSTLFCKFRQ